MRKTRGSYRFSLIYSLVFLLAIADAIAGYVQSSFLNQFFSLPSLGLIIGLCALSSLIASIWLPKLISHLSIYKTGLSLVIINIVCSLILFFSQNAVLILVAFLIRYLGFIFLLVVLDIFLEKISSDKITGFIRSAYLTIINIAWLASPWLMGLLVGTNNYGRIYLTGAIIMLALLALFIFNRKKLDQDSRTKAIDVDFLVSVKKLFSNKNLLAVFSSVIALNIFYAVAVIYIPIYLNRDLGFSWQTIGLIFTIMLLPFVLIQFPAGILADKRIGEKEMMMSGNVIMAIASAIIFITNSSGMFFWASLLFLSRVGAALAEGMQEIYFYKKINARDIGLINFFRQGRAIGWLIGSLLAFGLLKFTNIKGLFLAVAFILIINILQLTIIEDTK